MEKILPSGISSRIKEERHRLGYSQEAFAGLAGASKHSQINWEKGTFAPNADVLSVWMSSGADIPYILTGERGMSRDELELLTLFRTAPLAVKAAAIGALQGGGAAGGKTRTVTAHGGNAAGRDVNINKGRQHEEKGGGGY